MYFVYILASRRNGTLYTGITSDLEKRVWQHKCDFNDGFTRKYAVHRLVWFEAHRDVGAAIQREKRIKKWNRAWKIALIEKANPNWSDLFPTLIGRPPAEVRAAVGAEVMQRRRERSIL